MQNHRFELVGVGHIVKEMIYFPDRTIGPVLGSPPAYSLVASAGQGTICGVVTKIGPDFPQDLLDVFETAGVNTQGIKKCSQSSTTQLIYDQQGNKEIRFPTRADYINASDIPEVYHQCRIIYVCTMEDDIQLDQLSAVVSVGDESAIDLGGYGGVHMGKQRRSRIKTIPAFAKEAAGHFDFVKASDEDCRMIFGPAEPVEYGRMLLGSKTMAILITLGSKGALITTKKGVWHVPPLQGNPIDATGGGDTFMGGFLSEYIRCGDILKSAVFGSATALCVIEKTGGVLPQRMPSEKEVRSRILDGFIDKIKKL